MRSSPRLARLLGSAAFIAVAATALGSCQNMGAMDITGSIPNKDQATLGAADKASIDSIAEKYRANPRDPELALRYGQALRANGQREQAVAVLEQGTLANPGNKALLGGYGRALADNGNFKQAFDVLSRAHTPDNPDWHILSVQGVVLDQMGRHDDARGYYANALKIAPDEPSVLSNLGMSYILTKDLAKAEATLRKAADRNPNDARIKQNLALAIGLQGRFAEAETLVKGDLPPDQAAANVAYLKAMIGRGGTGRMLQSGPSSNDRS